MISVIKIEYIFFSSNCIIMQVEPNNISISVYEGNRERIQNASNSTEEFIILQNEELNRKNRDFIIQITEKDTKIEELETDNERMETSLSNMRGVLHNFSSKIKKQEQIIKLHEVKFKDLKDYTKVVNDFIKAIVDYPKLYGMVTISLVIALYIIGFMSIAQSLIFLMVNGLKLFIITFHLKSQHDVLNNVAKNTENMNQKITVYNNNIKAIRGEIVEIDRSNNFIEEYIDTI